MCVSVHSLWSPLESYSWYLDEHSPMCVLHVTWFTYLTAFKDNHMFMNCQKSLVQPFSWNNKVLDSIEQITHNIAGICVLWKCISYQYWVTPPRSLPDHVANKPIICLYSTLSANLYIMVSSISEVVLPWKLLYTHEILVL